MKKKNNPQEYWEIVAIMKDGSTMSQRISTYPIKKKSEIQYVFSDNLTAIKDKEGENCRIINRTEKGTGTLLEFKRSELMDVVRVLLWFDLELKRNKK